MPDIIRRIAHTVNQQSRWSVGADRDPWRKPEGRPGTGLIPQMSRIEQDREVRTGRLKIRRVERFVSELASVAHRRGEVATGRKPDHTDLMRIDSVRRRSVP